MLAWTYMPHTGDSCNILPTKAHSSLLQDIVEEPGEGDDPKTSSAGDGGEGHKTTPHQQPYRTLSLFKALAFSFWSVLIRLTNASLTAGVRICGASPWQSGRRHEAISAEDGASHSAGRGAALQHSRAQHLFSTQTESQPAAELQHII